MFQTFYSLFYLLLLEKTVPFLKGVKINPPLHYHLFFLHLPIQVFGSLVSWSLLRLVRHRKTPNV